MGIAAHTSTHHPQHLRGGNGSAVADALITPARHAPEVQLALAALLVVLAGPVARALAPTSTVMAGVSVVLLGVGLVLALLAAVSLLKGR